MTTVKIPRHSTERGTWCRMSGCDSTSGICRLCEPEPRLSERERAALAALAADGTPMIGPCLAGAMSAAGRETTNSAAHQAGAGLARKGLAIKGHRPGSDLIRYEVTNSGRDWLDRFRAVGGKV